MTIEELTNCRESLHVDSRGCTGVCGLSPVSAMKFCRTVPSTEARKSMTMSNTLMRVTTECVHACVHRRLGKKKKESDVKFYLFSKHLESGNVDNCIIRS